MRKIVAVVGSANIEDEPDQQALAFETGKLVVESGYSLATGGLGGVMEHASCGARAAHNYTEGVVIGVLPSYDVATANPNVDTIIPTGMGIARNLLLVSMANAVIAIGGGSGTLSEIAVAWQMQKLVIGLQTSGWSGKLAGKQLDSRRRDQIWEAQTASEAVQLVNQHIAQYANKQFGGVKPSRISHSSARELIAKHSTDEVDTERLEFLGSGSEGVVFKDASHIYKVIDGSSRPLELYWQLAALAERLNETTATDCIQTIQKINLCDGKYVFIQSPFVESAELIKVGDSPTAKYIQLLREFKRIGWVCLDLQPKNLRVRADGTLTLSDLGHSLFPFARAQFQSMCRRAFVIYKLQSKLRAAAEFKPYLTAVNESADFSKMSEFGFNQHDMAEQFEQFWNEVNTNTKKQVLNPVLKDLFSDKISAKSVLDYGAGHGDHAQMLTQLGMRVTAYEPDERVVEKYRGSGYAGVELVDIETLRQAATKSPTYDAVLCSLVLCYPLADDAEAEDGEVDKIVRDLVALTRRDVVVVICNPLYTHHQNSQMETRHLPDGFTYSNRTRYEKQILLTGRKMSHSHRPLAFYEELFRKHGLDIRQIIQTPISAQSSDFVVFVLAKR